MAASEEPRHSSGECEGVHTIVLKTVKSIGVVILAGYIID
jgi:hypothetical protein